MIGFSVALIAAACGDDDGTSSTATQDAGSDSGTSRVIEVGSARLTLPPGLETEVSFEADRSFQEEPDVLFAYRLEPDGLELDAPALLEFTLTANQVTDGVAAFSIDDEGVQPLIIDSVDLADDGSVTIGFLVEHFSSFTLNRFVAYTGARFEMQVASEVPVDAPFNVRVKMEPPEIGTVGSIPTGRWVSAEERLTVEGGPWFIEGDFTLTIPLSPPGLLRDRPARTEITDDSFEIIETFSCTEKADDVPLRYGAIMQFPVSSPEKGNFLFNSYVPFGVRIDCVTPKVIESVGSAFSESIDTPTFVGVQPIDGSSMSDGQIDGRISLSVAATDDGYLAVYLAADPMTLSRLCAIEFDVLDARSVLVSEYTLVFPGAQPGVDCPRWPFQPSEAVLSLPEAPVNASGVALQTDIRVEPGLQLSVWGYESLGNGTMRVINFKVSMSQVADTPALPPLTFERRAENDNSWMIINVTPKVIFGWEDDG